MFGLKKIMGLKVVAIKGSEKYKHSKDIEPKFILFDDGKTYIELEEQDYYSFHDCSTIARIIMVYQDKTAYNNIMDYYKDVNCDLY